MPQAANPIPLFDENRVKVMLADDHWAIRDGLRARLESEVVTVVGAAKNGEECVEMYSELLPDVLLCDVHLPGLDGIAATAAIRRSHPTAKIVMFSAHEDGPSIQAALDAGALGYLSKQTSRSELYLAIADAADGNHVFDATTAAAAVTVQRGELSRREREVLLAVANGATNAHIAAQLFISPLTVKTHLARILAKLGVRDRAAAVAVAMRRKLIS